MTKRRKTDQTISPPKAEKKESRTVELLKENANLRSDLAKTRIKLRQYIRAANFDPLTGLYNKRGLEESLMTVDQNKGGVVLAMDMRYLKVLNDTYGHEAGDAAIKHFSNSAQKALRKEDILARTGGDEFILILPDLKPEESWSVRLRLKQALIEPFDYNGEKLSVGIRIGVARYNADVSVHDAIKTADMREGKIRDNLRKQEPPRYTR